MVLGFVSDLYGKELACQIAKRIEYIWNEDRKNNLFAVSE